MQGSQESSDDSVIAHKTEVAEQAEGGGGAGETKPSWMGSKTNARSPGLSGKRRKKRGLQYFSTYLFEGGG